MQPLLLLWLAGAVFCDLRWRRVPNALVLAGMVGALLSLAVGAALPGLDGSAALMGGLAAFAVLLPFYALRLMGAGDVKFAAVLGLWLGLAPLLPIAIAGSLLAFAHAVAVLALRRWPFFPRLMLALSGRNPDGAASPSARRPIPYAAYLALAAFGWLAWQVPQ
ncbi:prepilin peptidase [uncultured Pseudacidovorax sp.]|uniref:A24 family peptidase n=1 Tax=uncultured Pseudacidovorax sp. TaxID=679313 RepID=UPI0025F25E9B|nr:A24 family peptidase [uncultured Pseudacidovorax sp.]